MVATFFDLKPLYCMMSVKKMKKWLILVLLSVSIQGILYAQSSPKERTDKVVNKFETVISISKETKNALKTIFTEYYQGTEKLREQLKSGKTQGEEAYQKARKQKELLENKREAQLKKTLTAEEYKKWITEINPTIKVD